MSIGRAVAGMAVGLVGLTLTPLRALAADPACPQPPPTVPEVPGGPALIIVAGLAVIGVLALIRRHRGISAAAVSTLMVVLIAGAMVGMIAAGADTACNPSGPGAVLGSDSGTGIPLTGADIPWITSAVLVSLGILTTVVALPRRQARGRTTTP